MRSVILAFLNNIISVCNKAIHVGSKYYQRSKGRRWCRNNNCTLTREQIRQTKEYWNKYTKNFNVVFHKKYSTVNGTFDVRYIPDDLYNSIINPYFNGRARDTSIANKSYYPLLFDCK